MYWLSNVILFCKSEKNTHALYLIFGKCKAIFPEACNINLVEQAQGYRTGFELIKPNQYKPAVLFANKCKKIKTIVEKNNKWRLDAFLVHSCLLS